MSNGLTQSLSERHEPKMAIIVYSGNGNSVYLEQRDINKGKMGAGRPLSKKCLTEIMRTLAEDSKELTIGYHGEIPKNLLFADTTTGRLKLVWYNPPRKRKMYFVNDLGIPNGEVKMPGIVYEMCNERLKVFAFKGRVPKDELYQAPFFNVNNHDVCLGSAKAKKPTNMTYAEAIKYWETLFWNSEFSHLYGANPIEGNLAVITKKCIEDKQPFPIEVLIPSNTKLSSILAR